MERNRRIKAELRLDSDNGSSKNTKLSNIRKAKTIVERWHDIKREAALSIMTEIKRNDRAEQTDQHTYTHTWKKELQTIWRITWDWWWASGWSYEPPINETTNVSMRDRWSYPDVTQFCAPRLEELNFRLGKTLWRLVCYEWQVGVYGDPRKWAWWRCLIVDPKGSTADVFRNLWREDRRGLRKGSRHPKLAFESIK